MPDRQSTLAISRVGKQWQLLCHSTCLLLFEKSFLFLPLLKIWSA